ncbi:MAG TPA: PAS domain-containing protein, partial [Oxalicibacterium sp.]|nr:PAS domain-containing protein [Oxalicibacterium sp.]
MFLKRSDSSGTQLLHLMEVAGEVVFRLDAAGTILHASQQSDELIGAGLAGRSLFELVELADR